MTTHPPSVITTRLPPPSDFIDIESQVFYYTQPVHSHYDTRYLKYITLASVVIFVTAALAAEYSFQQQLLVGEYTSVMVNRPPFCDGESPSDLVALMRHSINFNHQQQCAVYHRYKTFGPDSPNIALVLSTLFTKFFIIPVRECVLIFQAVAYITQMILVICFVISVSIVIYFIINYYTFKRATALADLRRFRRQQYAQASPTHRYQSYLKSF